MQNYRGYFPGRENYYSINELSRKYNIYRMTLSRYLKKAYKSGIIEMYYAPYARTGIILIPKKYEPIIADFAKQYHKHGVKRGRPTREKQLLAKKLGWE